MDFNTHLGNTNFSRVSALQIVSYEWKTMFVLHFLHGSVENSINIKKNLYRLCNLIVYFFSIPQTSLHNAFKAHLTFFTQTTCMTIFFLTKSKQSSSVPEKKTFRSVLKSWEASRKSVSRFYITSEHFSLQPNDNVSGCRHFFDNLFFFGKIENSWQPHFTWLMSCLWKKIRAAIRLVKAIPTE